jgi:hypothetical protein
MSESLPITVISSPPSGPRVAVVTSLAAIASVVVNAALVWLATAFDPSLRHYSHFRLLDYGTLTALGVICAGAAWYVATRNLAAPRHTFFQVAVAVMLVLWVPDVWLLIKHEPTRAVIFLIVMHLAIALITYNALVFAAPMGVHDATTVAAPIPRSDEVPQEDTAPERMPRVVWVVLMIAVAIEFFAGLIGMLYVPFNRPNGWLAHRGETFYLVHAVLGGLLGVAAIAVVLHVSSRTRVHRVDRVAAVSGLVGMLIGALGGVLCVSHPLRLLGMALMFVGVSVAFFGYLIPMIDDTHPLTSEPASTAR